MNAHDMVQTGFRHQHPEAYERAPVEEGSIPPGLRYRRSGGEEFIVSATLAEEPMGNGGFIT